MSIVHLSLDALVCKSDSSDFSSRRALEDVSLAVAKCRKAIVMSGAGISCSSGIPDFRSTDGLYSLVKARYPDSFVTGKDLFSASLFQTPQTSSIFYTFIAELSLACQKAEPTRTHHFVQRLESKGKLLRNYTQNIDGFERRLGMESGGRGKGLHKKATRNVELHGDLGRVRCVLCWTDFEAKADWTEAFREGEAPDCPSCEERCAARVARSARPVPIGTLRPSIVLYDEPHPLGDDIGQLQGYDLSRTPDLLLIMGTSLKVHGFKKLVKDFAKAVHSSSPVATSTTGKNKVRKGIVVYVNATPPSKEWEGIIDYYIEAESDKWVEKVEEDWRRLRPSDWETQTLLEDGVLGGVIASGKEQNTGKEKIKGGRKKTVKMASRFHLPTPSPSLSPSRSSVDQTPSSQSSTLSEAFSSPLSSAPPTPPAPLSPSKRAASTTTPSPTKKVKAVSPATGLPPTPGRGNLFMLPTPPSSQDAVLSPPAKSTRIRNKILMSKRDASDDVANDDAQNVFGKPAKAHSVAKKSGRTRMGKENCLDDVVALSAKGVAGQITSGAGRPVRAVRGLRSPALAT